MGEVIRLRKLWAMKRVWLTSEPQNFAARHAWTSMGFKNVPADRQVEGVWITTDLKGRGKNKRYTNSAWIECNA